MKRLLGVLILAAALMAGPLSALAAPPVQAVTPAITAFTTTATDVSRAALEARTARVPIAWATEGRTRVANLAFDQILPNGDVIDAEIPRETPWVPDSGSGVAAPILPADDATEITLRIQLRNVLTGEVYDEQTIVLPISDTGDAGGENLDRPAITAFNSYGVEPTLENLQGGAARTPIEWSTANRPATANLVFEQVLPNGSAVNIELPRDDPWLPDSGSGELAPIAPGSDATSFTLRARLVDLVTGRVYDQREIVYAIGTPAPPEITAFTTTAPAVNADSLANRSARVAVAWDVFSRPSNSNLLFEQVMPDGDTVNIELPRGDLTVPSSGTGVVAPIAPGGNAPEITLRLRLIDLASGETYTQKDLVIPVTDEPLGEPQIVSFTASDASVDASELLDGTARVQVYWQVDNRPDGSNLKFEQVMADGSTVNIELPRDNPDVPTAGAGQVAPVLPEGDATEITLRLSLIDTASGSAYTQSDVTVPVDQSTVQPVVSRFDTNDLSVQRSQLADGTARVAVAWQVDHQTEGTNLVFEQLLPDGSVANIELPRPDPIVPSSGQGTVAPVDPGNADVITLRIRLVNLTDDSTLAERLLWLPVEPPVTGITINSFTADPAQGQRGDSIRLSWNTTAATASITEILPSGRTGQVYDDLAPSSELDVTLSGGQGARFVLATYGDGSTGPVSAVTVSAPTRETTPAATNTMAFQPFEHGVMVWLSESQTIYVLYEDGTYGIYHDNWQDGDAETVTETAPDGLVVPQRGFGAIWSGQEGVRDRLGWGTAAEQGYTAETSTDADGRLILPMPDGSAVVLGDGWSMQ
ncbi:MAG TPA: hypothetical protein PKD09_06700 [Aggregatilinea sp.]|uniref:hypothetical protein n=1 Tax=Aggregatilinea sp. TaxID=2806333 RepID=UPI002C038F03|nr:hypothetical protein [Aggregatilinea sp.]HML21315.1 hypothetical protein [Aggregatilinea sp.]